MPGGTHHSPARGGGGRGAVLPDDPVHCCRPEGAVQEFATTDADGRPTGDPVQRRSSWLELQAHASQPHAATLITEVDLPLAFGMQPCWLYTVSVDGGHHRFWFAKALPGMPVMVEEWSEDRLGGRTQMIDNQPGAPLSPKRRGL